MTDFAVNHIIGDLKTPEDLDVLPTFSAGINEFVAPKSLPLMDYCLPTDDQGCNPWCAAYAAAGFAESILWRLRNYPEQMPPKWIYDYAKTIDGDPNGSGTSLVATLKALLWKGIFDEKVCSVKVIRTVEQLKFAIHKFGCCPVGFNISREWYRCNENKASICGEGDASLIGGHAVLACGFMPDGLYIHNSWGESWGKDGFAIVSWEEVERQFIYGAVLNNCLNNMTM
jgi:hypothetical protein